MAEIKVKPIQGRTQFGKKAMEILYKDCPIVRWTHEQDLKRKKMKF